MLARMSRAVRLCTSLWLALLLIGATGCSSERIAGWYVTRKLDDFLDLDAAQEEGTRVRVDEALAALRKDTLPTWIALLREGRARMATPASDAELAAMQDRYDALLDRAVAELAPRIAPVLADLGDAQVDHFQGKLGRLLDEKYADQLLAGAARRDKLDKQLVTAIEEVIGTLGSAQKATILAAIHALPDDRPALYQADKRSLAEVGHLLRSHPGAEAIDRELRRMWAARWDRLDPARDRATRLSEQRQVLLTISKTMTPKQRTRGVETMTDHIVSAKRFLLPDTRASAQ